MANANVAKSENLTKEIVREMQGINITKDQNEIELSNINPDLSLKLEEFTGTRARINCYHVKTKEKIDDMTIDEIQYYLKLDHMDRVFEAENEVVQIIGSNMKALETYKMNEVEKKLFFEDKLRSNLLLEELRNTYKTIQNIAKERNISEDSKRYWQVNYEDSPLKTFSGLDPMLNIYEFISLIENFTRKENIVNDDKGFIMYKYCSGYARDIVEIEFPFDYIPNYDEIKSFLMKNFGNKVYITKRMSNQHFNIGKIPEPSDEIDVTTERHQKTIKHLTLLKKIDLLWTDRGDKDYMYDYINNVADMLSRQEQKEFWKKQEHDTQQWDLYKILTAKYEELELYTRKEADRAQWKIDMECLNISDEEGGDRDLQEQQQEINQELTDEENEQELTNEGNDQNQDESEFPYYDTDQNQDQDQNQDHENKDSEPEFPHCYQTFPQSLNENDDQKSLSECSCQ